MTQIPEQAVTPEWVHGVEQMSHAVSAAAVETLCRALRAAWQDRDHLAEQLGLVYWHVTDGKLSKPYDFKAVESTIDDCLQEGIDRATTKIDADRAHLNAMLDSVQRAVLGESLPDFALSFPIVREVSDLALKVQAAETEAKTLREQLDDSERERISWHQAYHQQANQVLALDKQLTTCQEALTFYAERRHINWNALSGGIVKIEEGEKARETLKALETPR